VLWLDRQLLPDESVDFYPQISLALPNATAAPVIQTPHNGRPKSGLTSERLARLFNLLRCTNGEKADLSVEANTGR
jgi:hypothetical protein